MFVTTGQNASLDTELKAKRLAKELSCQFIGRKTFSLSQLKRRFGDEEVLVVDYEGLKFVQSNGLVLFFHPNLAKIRLTSMLKGSKDRMLEAAGAQPGDSVLDCTMGLATDAIMFSFAVGRLGEVTALESEIVPYILAKEGLKNYRSGIAELDKSMRRIQVIHSNHLDYMRNLPTKSVDIVYFDPMFRQLDKTVALIPLRGIANSQEISKEAILEAKRISRKAVVLREHQTSGEFERLGLQPVLTRRFPKIIYGTHSLTNELRLG